MGGGEKPPTTLCNSTKRPNCTGIFTCENLPWSPSKLNQLKISVPLLISLATKPEAIQSRGALLCANSPAKECTNMEGAGTLETLHRENTWKCQVKNTAVLLTYAAQSPSLLETFPNKAQQPV